MIAEHSSVSKQKKNGKAYSKVEVKIILNLLKMV